MLSYFATPASAAPATPTADAIATRVQAFYDQTKTFQASFKQEYFIRMHDQRRTSEGRVAFEKPGRMSWKYDQPNGNRVVSDGRTLKVYDRENQQMFEQPVDKSQYPAALAFLMGQGELMRSFTLSLLDPATVKFEGGWVLEGTPKGRDTRVPEGAALYRRGDVTGPPRAHSRRPRQQKPLRLQ